MNDEGELNEPPLQRDAAGNVDVDSVPDVIEWFLNHDQRVAVIKHPSVEEVEDDPSLAVGDGSEGPTDGAILPPAAA